MGQDPGIYGQTGAFPLSDPFAEMGSIPANDDGGWQVEPGHAVVLVLTRAVANGELPGKRRKLSEHSPMTTTLIRCARCLTDQQDPATQRQALLELGVAEDPIYTGHGLSGTTRARPGLDQALAAVRQGNTLVVLRLDRMARSVPDAGAIADRLRERGVKLALGRALYNPGDPLGKLLFNILATFAGFETDLSRMHATGEYSISGLADLFFVSRPTVYRTPNWRHSPWRTILPPAGIDP